MKLKRVLAFIIDSFIVMMISSFIFALPFFKTSYNEYMEKTEEMLKTVQEGNYDNEQDLVNMTYEVYKESSNLLMIRIGTSFIYFGVISYLWKGRTIGKKIFHLRVIAVREDNLNAGLYMLRCGIINNLFFDIVSVFCLILTKKSTWLAINDVISILEYIVLLVIVFLLIFRTDGRTLHDLICKTIVIEEERN